MFDSIEISQIPAYADAVAGYVGGAWPTFSLLASAFPNAHRLSIAISASEDAEALDIETGDATPAQAPGWAKRQQARGVARPVLYANLSTMPAVLSELSAAGIPRSQVRLWSAHYGAGAHICGPSTCGHGTAMDGTQWTDTALGRNLDQSLLSADFFTSGGEDEMTDSVAYWPVDGSKPAQKYRASVGTDNCLYYMGPETRGQWQGIASSNVKSGCCLAISRDGEKTIAYTNTSGEPCEYVAAPGSDKWVWQKLPGNVR